MASVDEIRSKVSARIWQSIAQSGVEVSAIPANQLQALVDSITDGVLVAVDEVVGGARAAEAAAEGPVQSNEEVVLWEGRPFLSLTESYLLTSERLRISRGLLGRDREDIELARLQDIDHKQNLGERVLNLGDVIIHSHDPSNPVVVLRNITDPMEVHEKIRRAMLDARDRHHYTFQEEM